MLLNIFLFFKALFSFHPDPAPDPNLPKTIYEFKVDGLTGGTIDFSKFRGKKILIVNTASKCGNTPQYETLEKLSKKYQKTLVIVGFPANNFGHQEPGTSSEINEFCQKNYGVTFPIAAKISVKGDDIAPIYQWLTNKEYNGYQNSNVKWNFQKYLIDEKGNLVAVFAPGMQPDNAEIIAAIEKQ